MKKFVNDPKQFVPEMLKGIALANPDTLKYVPEYNLIMRADAPRDDKVSIIQGSGSGHEPAHVMVVGKGMLDAACPGDVFAAPPMDYVLETSKLLASPKGVLHIVNNYTGDRMAFDMGQEMAEADGITIGTLIVDDDVAVKDSTYTVGRRGVAGNFFVIKAVGAASEQGADLDELVRIGKKVNSVTRTMGMALTSCTPPAKGSPLFELGDDEMEMGVGIHGEPGRRREKLASANEIVDELLEAVVTDLPFSSGDDVALMINGLGGTPISELYLLYGRAHEQLAKRGINVAAQLRRRVLHVARHGRRLAHAAPAGRRDRRAARRARRDRHPGVLATGELRLGERRECVPRLVRRGGGLPLRAAAPVVAPAAAGARLRREHLVVLLPGQRGAHPLVRLGALRGDVLGPPQVPLQRLRGVLPGEHLPGRQVVQLHAAAVAAQRPGRRRARRSPARASCARRPLTAGDGRSCSRRRRARCRPRRRPRGRASRRSIRPDTAIASVRVATVRSTPTGSSAGSSPLTYASTRALAQSR